MSVNTPGGPWMRAISGAHRLNRTTSFWESFNVWSINLTSVMSSTSVGADGPRRMLARGDNLSKGVSLNRSMVSRMRLNVTSFASLTLMLTSSVQGNTANNEFQIQRESLPQNEAIKK